MSLENIFKIAVISLLILAGAVSFDAQSIIDRKPFVTVDLWPDGKMPGRGASEPEKDMPDRGDGVQRISNVSRPTIAVYPAKKKNSKAIIVSPGGGYSYVTYNKEGTDVAAWLNENGITAIVLKYRVPNNRDGALQDIQRAISLVRANAKAWNVNPKKLGVMGFSAGGHLSAKASTNFDQRSYEPIDDIDKKSCRPDFAVLVYPAYLDDKKGNVSSEFNFKAKIPPTLIVHTEDDKNFIAGSKLYQAALDKAKINNEFMLYPTGGHGYGLHGSGEVQSWPPTALLWLEDR